MQLRLLVAQPQDLGGHAAVVGGAGMLAARGPGAPRSLAQVAPLREGEEGHDVRTRERDQRAAVVDAVVERGLAQGSTHERRQASEVGFALQHQPKAGLVGQHVLAEARGELGQALHHLGIALLAGAGHARAGSHVVDVKTLEHAPLLAAQGERIALRMQCVEPREHAGVHVDPAVMRGQQWCHVALDGLQCGRGLARREVVEQAADAVEEPARAIERGDGVLERRRIAGPADGVDLGQVPRHRDLERRCELLRTHLGERRHAVRARPVSEQRIGGVDRSGGSGGSVHFFFRLMSSRSRSS